MLNQKVISNLFFLVQYHQAPTIPNVQNQNVFVVTAADSEIASPLEDTVCDSDERIFETHNVFNNSAFANGSNSDGQPSLNQIDRGSIKSAVSITSDDVTSDRLSNESIQVTVAENNIDSNYTQHSESAEILEAIDAKSEGELLFINQIFIEQRASKDHIQKIVCRYRSGPGQHRNNFSK